MDDRRTSWEDPPPSRAGFWISLTPALRTCSPQLQGPPQPGLGVHRFSELLPFYVVPSSCEGGKGRSHACGRPSVTTSPSPHPGFLRVATSLPQLCGQHTARPGVQRACPEVGNGGQTGSPLCPLC